MENPTGNSFKENGTAGLRKDRSIVYMGVILGAIILAMAYMTLFTDDPWEFFRSEEKTSLIQEKESDLNEIKSMSDEEVRKSLIKFIQAFYYDQQKGYFDPPSYFAPITKTFYNFHNLTYERLRDVHRLRQADMKNLDRNWIVSTLDFSRTDSGIVATYWAIEKYFNPSKNQQQSIDRKYEMIIDDAGRIYSLREIEFRNFESYTVSMDTAEYAAVISTPDPVDNQVLKDQKIFDVSMVDAAPEFKGGQAEFTKFLQANLKYPAPAMESKIQGRVYLSFIIDKDGIVRNVNVRQGLGSGCDEEAVRLMRTSPPWNPGKVAGNAVNTYFVMPVPFQLN